MQPDPSRSYVEPAQPVAGAVVVEDPAPGARYGELDIFAFVLLLLRHLPFILGCGAVAFLWMVALMLHAKPRYSSTAVMIIPQGNITSSGLEAKLSASTADLLGGGFELYADILQSRTVADRIIKDHDLMHVYGVPKIEYAERQLASLTKVDTLREGVLRVTTQDQNPQRAADIANDYLHQLDLLNSSLVLTSVSEERAYLEREMIKEKDALADAEVALKEVQESTSGLPPDAVANASLNALTTTRAQLRADQVQLAALLTGETEQNPEVIRLRSEIGRLSGQLQTLEKGEASTANGTPTSKVPEETLIYTRRARDVKFHETLFGLLETEFDAAKQQEAKTPTIVQVLDPAVPSPDKSWPPRTYYCVMAGLLGTLLGVVLISLRALVQAYLRAPQNQLKLRELKHIFRPAMFRRS